MPGPSAVAITEFHCNTVFILLLCVCVVVEGGGGGATKLKRGCLIKLPDRVDRLQLSSLVSSSSWCGHAILGCGVVLGCRVVLGCGVVLGCRVVLGCSVMLGCRVVLWHESLILSRCCWHVSVSIWGSCCC